MYPPSASCIIAGSSRVGSRERWMDIARDLMFMTAKKTSTTRRLTSEIPLRASCARVRMLLLK